MKMWQYSTYSKIDPLARRHFPFKKARPDQLETISEIIHAISRGYRYIVLEAGTGTGKSAIAYTLASIYDSSYILTVTKQLQQQYLNDFSSLKLVKGRKNFECSQYINQSCDEGKCILEGEPCRDPQNTCDYYSQKFAALNSKTVISNYHYMFLELNYVGDFTKRQLLICDEAHNLEGTLMSQLKLEFSIDDLEKYLKLEIGDDILFELENGDYDVWLQFIGEIRDSYQRELSRISDVRKPHLLEKISFIRKEISERVSDAGIEIIEARITYLAYATEIAAVMLQRQQASAIIDARKMIVDGAVGMVEMALERLKEHDTVQLDEERKAQMVSNLLVVLCGNRDAQPIVNSGSIY